MIHNPEVGSSNLPLATKKPNNKMLGFFYGNIPKLFFSEKKACNKNTVTISFTRITLYATDDVE